MNPTLGPGRREIMMKCGQLALGTAAMTLFPWTLAGAEEMVEVAYAASMTSVMEGPIQEVAAKQLGLKFAGRAQGASGLARLIASGAIRPDVFISVTPSPMQTVLGAGKAADALALARTQMVIAFSRKSRFAADFREVQAGGAKAWWQVLEEPGLRFGRTDPVTDPQGRNIIFVMQLAARFYQRPDLAEKILGPIINPAQIFAESSLEVRLQSGELDAAAAYKTQPGPFDNPYLELPAGINLGEATGDAQVGISVSLEGKSYYPEPLVYYACALRDASHPAAAARFLEWMGGEQAQAILRKYGYDSVGKAVRLRS